MSVTGGKVDKGSLPPSGGFKKFISRIDKYETLIDKYFNDHFAEMYKKDLRTQDACGFTALAYFYDKYVVKFSFKYGYNHNRIYFEGVVIDENITYNELMKRPDFDKYKCLFAKAYAFTFYDNGWLKLFIGKKLSKKGVDETIPIKEMTYNQHRDDNNPAFDLLITRKGIQEMPYDVKLFKRFVIKYCDFLIQTNDDDFMFFHGDVKSDNIIFDKGRYKFIDLGTSTIKNHVYMLQNGFGGYNHPALREYWSYMVPGLGSRINCQICDVIMLIYSYFYKKAEDIQHDFKMKKDNAFFKKIKDYYNDPLFKMDYKNLIKYDSVMRSKISSLLTYIVRECITKGEKIII